MINYLRFLAKSTTFRDGKIHYYHYLRLVPFLLVLLVVGDVCWAATSHNSNHNSKWTKEELCYLPATQLLELFRAKELSPVDVLQAQIERIEALNPKVNAISEKHYEEALAQAKESENRYQQGKPRALEGLTCALKDDVDVKGWRMTMGSLIHKDLPPSEEDSALTNFLQAAGVVMHVQTTVPEYYCNLVTWNKLFGITRNPWNTRYTPGGSSGGSAAALAAGFTTLATGSDMGGSIRFPAAMTGIYGFKPPFGRVPSSLIQYESSGPLARTMEDLNIFQNAIAGPSPKTIATMRPKLEYPKKYGSIKGWRIAYDPMKDWGLPIDSTVSHAMQEAVAILRSLGAEVEEVDLGFRMTDFETYALGIFSTSIGPFCFNEPLKHPNLITPYLQLLVQKYAREASPQYLAVANKWIKAHHKSIQDKVFSHGFKAIIMPTLCSPYVMADMGSTPANTVITINGKSHPADTWVYSFTWPWNMLGQYPVVNVPVGSTAEQIPLGMQIIANTYDDLTAFQVAAAWSKAVPTLYQKKKLPAFK